jgi:HK97 gp10 family phage protein
MGSKLLTPSNLRFGSFKLSGIDEYLKKIEAMGRNVDEAVNEAIKESARPIQNEITYWAAMHSNPEFTTGAVLKGSVASPVQRDGNFIYVDVGIDTSKSINSWHAVFIEYGSPTQSPDPGIRRAFESYKNDVKKIQRKVLKKWGVPTG